MEFLQLPMPGTAAETTGTYRQRRAPGTVFRYGLSASGPAAVSLAHFSASLIVLQILPRADFGLFSFILVIVPLCLSVSGALLGAPITAAHASTPRNGDMIGADHLKANFV
jgi:hypothetical protein